MQGGRGVGAQIPQKETQIRPKKGKLPPIHPLPYDWCMLKTVLALLAAQLEIVYKDVLLEALSTTRAFSRRCCWDLKVFGICLFPSNQVGKLNNYCAGKARDENTTICRRPD